MRDRVAVGCFQIAEDEGRPFEPRQDSKRRGHRPHRDVTRPDEGVEHLIAARLPEPDRVDLARVLVEERSRHANAPLQCSGHAVRGDRLASQQPVLVGEHNPHAVKTRVSNLIENPLCAHP
jgi:hypothetical protein